jgi:hypothetical protein
MAVTMKSIVFWVETRCHSERAQSFRKHNASILRVEVQNGRCKQQNLAGYLHGPLFSPEDGGLFLNNMVSQPRKLYSSF